MLHLGLQSFTLTFGQKLASALIYFTDNPTLADGELDFGIAPIVLSGDVAVNGTRFSPVTLSGGLVRLDGIDSNSLIHTQTQATGGLNFAIEVTPSELTGVPEPSSIAMLCGMGATGMACYLLRRRRTAS